MNKILDAIKQDEYLKDLRKYTGESGGSHGLDDVSKGIVHIHNGTPHCKYHGAMLKVSKDGIWRCCITDFRTVGGGEISTNHGAYYNYVNSIEIPSN